MGPTTQDTNNTPARPSQLVTPNPPVVTTQVNTAQDLRTESLPNISPTWRTDVFVNGGKTLDKHISETPQQKVEKISPRSMTTDSEKPILDINTLRDLINNNLLGDTLEITGFKIEGLLALPRDINIKLTNCEFDKEAEISFQGPKLEIDNCKFNEQTFLQSYYRDTDIKISNSTFATPDKKCDVTQAAENSLTIIGGARNLEIQNSSGILNLTSLKLKNDGTSPNKVKYLNKNGEEITSFNDLAKDLRILTPQKYLNEQIVNGIKEFKQSELERKIEKIHDKETELTTKYIEKIKADVEKPHVVSIKDKILSIFNKGQAKINEDLDNPLETITKLHNKQLELEAKKNHQQTFEPEVPKLIDNKLVWHKKYTIAQKLGNYEAPLYIIFMEDLERIHQHATSKHGVIIADGADITNVTRHTVDLNNEPLHNKNDQLDE